MSQLENIELVQNVPNETKRTSSPHIIGGKDAPVGKYPYQVSLRFNDTHICAGSIIDNFNVLTAASCVVEMQCLLDKLKVHVGTNFLNETGYVYDVASVSVHQNYDNYLLNSDVALIHLKFPLVYNKLVQPIKYAVSGSNFEDQLCTLSGWGITAINSKIPYNNLQEIQLTVLKQTVCTEGNWRVTDNHICTAAISNKGPCKGDYGGPLVINGTQVGILSFSSDPCAKGQPDIYTRVTSFIAWILTNLKY